MNIKYSEWYQDVHKMVSRNYNVQSDKGITLNAKSPNTGTQYSTKTNQSNVSKTKQNIHYQQASVGTQYCSQTTQYTYSAPLPKTKYEKSSIIPTYTPTVNQDLSTNVDLKSIKPIGEPIANFTFVPVAKDPIYSESSHKRNYTESAPYPKNTSSFSANSDTYSVKSFKIRSTTPSNGSSNNNAANLPTIAESVVEDGEYPVDVGNHYEYSTKAAKCLANTALRGNSRDEAYENRQEDSCCREHAVHSLRSGHFQYATEISDTLKERNKYKYQVCVNWRKKRKNFFLHSFVYIKKFHEMSMKTLN